MPSNIPPGWEAVTDDALLETLRAMRDANLPEQFYHDVALELDYPNHCDYSTWELEGDIYQGWEFFHNPNCLWWRRKRIMA